MFTSLYTTISYACCYITVFLGDEKISEGTGFSYTPTGEVITAAHVLTGRWPIRLQDYVDPTQRFFCKFPGIPTLEYKVALCSIEIEVPGFTGNVQVDIAVLLPKVPSVTPMPHIPASPQPPKLGERVFMAGFSEEVSVPFDFNNLLSEDLEGVKAFQDAMRYGYMADMTGPMFKHGFVGNVRRVETQVSNFGGNIFCDVIYVDNGMHSGASGGPLFNENGEAVGVITQRAITNVITAENTMLPIPAGSTIAIGIAPIDYAIKNYQKIKSLNSK